MSESYVVVLSRLFEEYQAVRDQLIEIAAGPLVMEAISREREEGLKAKRAKIVRDMGAVLVDGLMVGAVELQEPEEPKEPGEHIGEKEGDEEEPGETEQVEMEGWLEQAEVRDEERPVELTPELKKGLEQSLSGGSLGQRTTSEKVRRERDISRRVLDKALKKFGSTPSSLKRKARGQELKRLQKGCDELLDSWAMAGKEVNHALTSWITARMRAAMKQGARCRLFRDLAEHSRITQPGVVHGLAKDHRPTGGSWLEVARKREQAVRELLKEFQGRGDSQVDGFNSDEGLRRLIDEIDGGLSAKKVVDQIRALLEQGVDVKNPRFVGLAVPYLDVLMGDEFSDLRREIATLKEEEEEGREAASRLSEDWPGFEATRGKKAALVGGDPRAERERRIKEEFGFAEVSWLQDPRESTHQVDGLVERMKRGAVDLVIVSRAHNKHRVSEKLFGMKDNARVVQVDSFSILQIQLGIERFLGIRDRAAS